MSQAPRQSWSLYPIRASASAFGMSGSTLMRLDPYGLRCVATILVWAHWFVVTFCLAQVAYRPSGWPERYAVYAPYCCCKGWGHASAACCAGSAAGPVSSNRAAASLRARRLVWVLE